MHQQINLYQPVSNVRNEPFSAVMMLVLLCFTLLMMMGFYGMLFWKKSTMQTEISVLQTQYEQTLMTVAKLEATVAKVTDSSKEKKQLKHLKKIYASKQNALNELSTMVIGNSDGVSEYFSALARQNIEPIWFSDINVYSGGQQLFLQGKTTDAQYIPQFMASLKEETVFNGINFKLFKAQRDGDDDLIRFKLQTEVKPLSYKKE